MTVTATQFRDYIAQFIGYEYCFCDRCGGSCHCFDCSGVQCKACNGLGLTRNLCTTSFVLARMCTDLGLEMTVQQAEADDGPDAWWAFKGADHGRIDDGSKPNGASGHIVLVVRVRDANGKTVGFYTIEAMGRRYGVVRGKYEGRGWTGHYKIPGVTSKPLPPPSLLERTMIVQKNHYNPDGSARPIPYKDKDGEFILATIVPAIDGRSLELDRGASMRGDQEIDDNHRRYVPDDLGGAKIIAICEWEPQDGSVPGGILRYSDGRRRPVRFS